MIYFYQQSNSQDFFADFSIQSHQRSKHPVSSKGVGNLYLSAIPSQLVLVIHLTFQCLWDSSVFFIFCACLLASLLIVVLIIFFLTELQTEFLWKLVIASKQRLWPWRYHFWGHVSTVKWNIVQALYCKGRVVLFPSTDLGQNQEECTWHGAAMKGHFVHKAR